MVDTSTNRVIFAEAGKDVFDFLFDLLQLPLASLIRAAASGCCPGSTSNVYESLKTLDSSFIHQPQAKDSLLNPRTDSLNAAWLLSPNGPPTATQVKYFICPGLVSSNNLHKNIYNGRHISSVYGHLCPHCKSSMTVELQQAGPHLVVQNVGEGYVKELVTYMVTDDLRITPMSGISSVLLLNEMQVQDVGLLEMREVSIGASEGLELLMTSLQSKTVLTDVLLKKKEKEKAAASKKILKRAIQDSLEC